MLAVITDIIGIIVIICCFREEFGAKGRGVCLPEPSVIALPDLANISPNQCVVYLKFIFNWCILSLGLNQLNLLEAGSGSPRSVPEIGSSWKNWEPVGKNGSQRGKGTCPGRGCVCVSVYVYMCISDQIRSVAQSCPTLCDPMNRSTPGLPVHHQLPEFTEIHVHRVSDAIQPSYPLSSPSSPVSNPSQHQGLFQ